MASRRSLVLGLIVIVGLAENAVAQQPMQPPVPSLDPILLPTPPRVSPGVGPVLTDDLANVPEAEFQLRTKPAPKGQEAERLANQLAKIKHVNAKKPDAFMTALLAQREDLAGLPFAMGDDCRTSRERTKEFTKAVSTVRLTLDLVKSGKKTPFWTLYNDFCETQNARYDYSEKEILDHVFPARIAALMQMLAAESPEIRLGLVKHLSANPHIEATKALARIAIFSPEADIRNAAIDSLKSRPVKDYTQILIKGLRYPWPAVAKESAVAIARTGRTDLIPELIGVLESNDPRMPESKTVDAKQVLMVREMVKVNHLRNCMMCHAPGNSDNVPAYTTTAAVPVPGQFLQSDEGYSQSSQDLMVRIDVTYLRQDFSAQLAVEDSQPWPNMQRFDFFVRERKITAEEAEVYKMKLAPKEAGVLSPYHKAALAALRELTGKDTPPTPEAWRKLLNLPIATTKEKVVN